MVREATECRSRRSKRSIELVYSWRKFIYVELRLSQHCSNTNIIVFSGISYPGSIKPYVNSFLRAEGYLRTLRSELLRASLVAGSRPYTTPSRHDLSTSTLARSAGSSSPFITHTIVCHVPPCRRALAPGMTLNGI